VLLLLLIEEGEQAFRHARPLWEESRAGSSVPLVVNVAMLTERSAVTALA
jgi:hypothetical protein